MRHTSDHVLCSDLRILVLIFVGLDEDSHLRVNNCNVEGIREGYSL